jgi:hypothetical protein
MAQRKVLSVEEESSIRNSITGRERRPMDSIARDFDFIWPLSIMWG